MPRAAPDAAQAALTKELRREAGQWLKAARETTGITQAELAERVGLRYYTFVSQVESGLGRVPIDLQAAWAAALGQEAQAFAKHLLGYYEPELFRLLFGNAARRAGSAKA
ncbi:helix-turn-helix domain-containing protein [Sphingoaurantiacus capsulatus]|uniref:Helix-turn-helix domain-containing protein n=1 Tax=Sphingoaurantiacus capsulatus TaxID=1771310 RepID=A0ABV7XB71_9SPHN